MRTYYLLFYLSYDVISQNWPRRIVKSKVYWTLQQSTQSIIYLLHIEVWMFEHIITIISYICHFEHMLDQNGFKKTFGSPNKSIVTRYIHQGCRYPYLVTIFETVSFDILKFWYSKVCTDSQARVSIIRGPCINNWPWVQILCWI